MKNANWFFISTNYHISLLPFRFGGGGGGRFGGGSGGRPRGGGPGRKTNHRIIVENLSSRTSWQVGNDCIQNWENDFVRFNPELKMYITGASREENCLFC